MQGFTLAAITDAVLRSKITKSMDMKYRSKALGQGACLKQRERNFDVKVNKVNGP